LCRAACISLAFKTQTFPPFSPPLFPRPLPAEEAKEAEEEAAPAAAEYDASSFAQALPGAEEGYDAYG